MSSISERVERIETFGVDGGWKTHGFVKVTTDSGVVGWGEYSHDFAGVSASGADGEVAFSDAVALLDGRRVESEETSELLARFAARSATHQQAVGAIGNALLDIRARARGIAVHELLGGAKMTRIPLYWGHCGSYRVTRAEILGIEPIVSLDGIEALGREVADRGYGALKANVLLFDGDDPARFKAEAHGAIDAPTLERVARNLADELDAFRSGTGDKVAILLDIGAGYRVEEAIALLEVAATAGVAWVEVEFPDPDDLATVRRSVDVAIATGERLGADEYRAFVAAGAADVLVVDVPYLGLPRSLEISAATSAAGVGVAPHNCYSPLASAMSATFCALSGSPRWLEYDVDGVPWEHEFVTEQLVVRDGHLDLPTGPGWGTAIDEDAVARHPRRG